jgi:hypothetical protein
VVPSWVEVGVEGGGPRLSAVVVQISSGSVRISQSAVVKVGPMAIGRGAVGSIGGCG